jgi:integrase
MNHEPLNFTKSWIERLGPAAPGTREVWRDQQVPGLQLIVTEYGSKSFYVRKKLRGRSERFFVGRYPALTVEAARRRAQEIIGKVATGHDASAIRERRTRDISLGQLFVRYLDDFAKLHKRTWEQDRAQFERYLGRWRGRRVDSLTRSDVVKLHAQVGAESGHYAANRILALLSKLYNFAIDLKLCTTENPASRVRKFRETPRKRFLSAEELPRFFDSLDAEPNDTVRDFVWLALLTGQRRSNVMAMRWTEIDLAAGTWTIPRTKNGTAHTVPLPQKAIDILEDRKSTAEGEFVFPGVGRSGHLAEPKTAWRGILARAGIKDLRIHDLRHTLASWQAGTGASLLVIGQTLNHKTAAATHRYAHLSSDTVRSAMAVAVDAMLAAGGQPMQNDGDGGREYASGMGQSCVPGETRGLRTVGRVLEEAPGTLAGD